MSVLPEAHLFAHVSACGWCNPSQNICCFSHSDVIKLLSGKVLTSPSVQLRKSAGCRGGEILCTCVYIYKYMQVYICICIIHKLKGCSVTFQAGSNTRVRCSYTHFSPGHAKGQMVSAKPLALFPREIEPFPVVQDARWTQGPVMLFPENLAPSPNFERRTFHPVARLLCVSVCVCVYVCMYVYVYIYIYIYIQPIL